MKKTAWLSLPAGLALAAAGLWTFSPIAAAPAGNADLRKQMNETFRQGNYKDAYEGFRKLAFDPKNNSRQVGDDLSTAVLCLENLDRAEEIDGLLARLTGLREEAGDHRAGFEVFVIPNAMPSPDLYASLEKQGVTSTLGGPWRPGDPAFASFEAKREAMEAFAAQYL